jgi:hypothetical protein
VALFHPEWDRSCASCEKFLYSRDGTCPVDRKTRLPLLRPPGTPTPCTHCPKVPEWLRGGGDWKTARAAAVDLTTANRKAIAFYRRCEATGRFPDDPLVAWYSALIAAADAEFARWPAKQILARLDTLVLRLGR